jgi:hypothetical protein
MWQLKLGFERAKVCNIKIKRSCLMGDSNLNIKDSPVLGLQCEFLYNYVLSMN